MANVGRPKMQLMEKTARHRVEFTPERKQQYIDELRRTGLRTKSAEVTGVYIGTVRDHMKKDPVFREEVENAMACWVDEAVVKPAHERATLGVEKPIIGGRNRDEVVAYETTFSDSLMAMFLKAHVPEMRGDTNGSDSNGGTKGGVLAIPTGGKKKSVDDWDSSMTKMSGGDQ